MLKLKCIMRLIFIEKSLLNRFCHNTCGVILWGIATKVTANASYQDLLQVKITSVLHAFTKQCWQVCGFVRSIQNLHNDNDHHWSLCKNISDFVTQLCQCDMARMMHSMSRSCLRVRCGAGGVLITLQGHNSVDKRAFFGKSQKSLEPLFSSFTLLLIPPPLLPSFQLVVPHPQLNWWNGAQRAQH